jgi:(p)ppGpp synthase/HD superfamily hydrolase
MDDVREIFENAGDEKTPELLESVRRNLFIEDIYVFTPANELKKLPRGATALDFAFENSYKSRLPRNWSKDKWAGCTTIL